MSGRGLYPPTPRIAPWDNVFRLPDFTGERTEKTLADDWYFTGLGPQTAVEIPWTWISGPLRQRQDSALNAAQVSVSGGATAYASDSSSISTYGQWPFSATLYTATDVDAQNLADWIVDYYTAPRVRLPLLRFKLNKRTRTECWTLLGREVGDRITLTQTPTGWPAGATQLVIEGITHSSAVDEREVLWSTAPVIGTSADTTGPWLRLGVTDLSDATDAIPY